jgi:hypothetical protein
VKGGGERERECALYHLFTQIWSSLLLHVLGTDLSLGDERIFVLTGSSLICS